MLKVLMDTSPLASEHATRGIGSYTRLLVSELEKLDDVTVLRSSTLARKERVEVDVVHYPFYDLFFSTLPLSFTMPTVVTIHDLIPLKYPAHYAPGIKGKLRFERQKLAVKTVNAIITDSESSKKDIIEHLGLSEEKIHVVYLAANPQLVPQDERAVARVRRKYKLPQKYILYVGDINYNKNIPQLIKAVKFLPPSIKLVCVGKNFEPQDIPEWHWIETQLALSDVTKRVTFVPNVLTDSLDDLSAVYAGAHCYVQPSLYEGFGLPLLEAMQCRTPVVSTNTSSLPEVGGEHAVYCDPDAQSIADAVMSTLDWSQTHRDEVIRSAYKWSQTFSWSKTAAQTLAVYQKVSAKS